LTDAPPGQGQTGPAPKTARGNKSSRGHSLLRRPAPRQANWQRGELSSTVAFYFARPSAKYSPNGESRDARLANPGTPIIARWARDSTPLDGPAFSMACYYFQDHRFWARSKGVRPAGRGRGFLVERGPTPFVRSKPSSGGPPPARPGPVSRAWGVIPRPSQTTIKPRSSGDSRKAHGLRPRPRGVAPSEKGGLDSNWAPARSPSAGDGPWTNGPQNQAGHPQTALMILRQARPISRIGRHRRAVKVGQRDPAPDGSPPCRFAKLGPHAASSGAQGQVLDRGVHGSHRELWLGGAPIRRPKNLPFAPLESRADAKPKGPRFDAHRRLVWPAWGEPRKIPAWRPVPNASRTLPGFGRRKAWRDPQRNEDLGLPRPDETWGTVPEGRFLFLKPDGSPERGKVASDRAQPHLPRERFSHKLPAAEGGIRPSAQLMGI